jgi:hypothetical protein
MQYIPPFLCQIIDALAFQGDPADLRGDWLAWQADFQGYFERESDYTVSKEDALIVENLPPLLQQLESAVEKAFSGDCLVDDLVTYAVDFFEAHDAFFEEREKQFFVQNPALDRLLKASVAHLQGLAKQEAILKRAPDAALAVDAIHDLYLMAREELPKELVEGTVDGFKRAQKGFDLLAEQEGEIPREVLEEAIFELKSAGELLEHLPNIFNRFEEEEGSSVPILGPILNLLREGDDEEQIELLKSQGWPAFVELWETRQDGWLLEPDVAYEILPSAEQTIIRLSELVEVYPEEDDEFWDTIDRLEDIFEQIRVNSLQLDELPSSPYWPEAQLLINLLRGGAPLYAAYGLASGIKEGGQAGQAVPPIIRSIEEALSAFLAEPEPMPLLQALKLLQEDFELSKTSRGCPACGARIALDARQCGECGAEVSELSISG